MRHELLIEFETSSRKLGTFVKLYISCGLRVAVIRLVVCCWALFVHIRHVLLFSLKPYSLPIYEL